MTMVKVAEIRAVDRTARENARGDRREHMTGVREGLCVRLVQWNKAIAASGVRNNAEGTADLVG
jgi:hypothetical protein